MPLRIQVLSDIHTDFHRDYGNKIAQEYLQPENIDVLVIAGDLATAGILAESLDVLAKRYEKSQILYVPGNHEFYGSNVASVRKLLKQIATFYKNVQVLDNGMTFVKGIPFVGSTLWFEEQPGYAKFRNLMSDFGAIGEFLPFELNKEAKKFLDWHVTDQSIVITHHLPSPKSIAQRHINNPLNMFFVCDIEKLILERQPKLWIHGHTHESCNYMIGKTHIVCNPLGYIGREVNSQFIPNCIVEVESC